MDELFEPAAERVAAELLSWSPRVTDSWLEKRRRYRRRSLMRMRKGDGSWPSHPAQREGPSPSGPAPQPKGSSVPPGAKGAMPPAGKPNKATFPPAKEVDGPDTDVQTIGKPKGKGAVPPGPGKSPGKAKPKGPPVHTPGNNGSIDKAFVSLLLKTWSDEARAAALESRRSKNKSLGQYVAGGPSNLRHKKRERATTLERRKADEQAFHQRASALAAEVRGSNRAQRQAGIAGAKALLGRGAQAKPAAAPAVPAAPAAPAVAASGSGRRLTPEAASQRRTANRPQRKAQLQRAIEHLTDRQEARSDANLREYGDEVGFNYSSKDLLEMYPDEVRREMKDYPKAKHVTIGVPSHGEVRIPRRVAQRHLGKQAPIDKRFLSMLLKAGYKASQPRGEGGRWSASMTTSPRTGHHHYDIKGPEGQHYTRTSKTRDDYTHALLATADDGVQHVVSMHRSHDNARSAARNWAGKGKVLELATGKVSGTGLAGAAQARGQGPAQPAPEPDAPPVHPDGKPIKPKGLQIGTKGQPKNLRDLNHDIGRVSHVIRNPPDKGVDPQHYPVLRRMAEALAHHHGTDPQFEYDMALSGHDPRHQGYKDFKDQIDAKTAEVKAEHAQFDPIKHPPPPPPKAKRVKKQYNNTGWGATRSSASRSMPGSPTTAWSGTEPDQRRATARPGPGARPVTSTSSPSSATMVRSLLAKRSATAAITRRASTTATSSSGRTGRTWLMPEARGGLTSEGSPTSGSLQKSGRPSSRSTSTAGPRPTSRLVTGSARTTSSSSSGTPGTPTSPAHAGAAGAGIRKRKSKPDFGTVIGRHSTGAPVTYHGASIHNPRVYEKLRSKGYDKSKSAAISNAMANKYGASTLRPKKVKKLTPGGIHAPESPTSQWLKPGAVTSQGGRVSVKALSTPRRLPRLNLTTGRKPPKSSLSAFHGALTRSTGGSAQMGRGGSGSTVGGNRTYRV